jgi:ParB-like chromosome segregation protein Spo0J
MTMNIYDCLVRYVKYKKRAKELDNFIAEQENIVREKKTAVEAQKAEDIIGLLQEYADAKELLYDLIAEESKNDECIAEAEKCLTGVLKDFESQSVPFVITDPLDNTAKSNYEIRYDTGAITLKDCA